MRKFCLWMMLLWACSTHLALADAPGYIAGVTAASSQDFNTTNRYGPNTTNNSGMTEDSDGVGSKLATQSNTSTHMWMTNTTTPNVAHYIDFNLGSAQTLREMWVWNYNQAGNLTKRGLRKVNVLYKLNAGDAWTMLKAPDGGNVFEFAQTPVNDAFQPATNQTPVGISFTATKQAGASPILFNGISAQYVRIQQINAILGEANWNATNTEMYCGLSEVRFYSDNSSTTANITPSPINFGQVKVGSSATKKMVIAANGQVGNVVVNGATLLPQPAITVTPPATLPATLSNYATTTYSLTFTPTAAGVFRTTATMDMLVNGAPVTKLVPIQGVGYDFEPNFIRNVSATASTSMTAAIPAARLVDSSGMFMTTGTLEQNIGSINALCDGDPYNMWTTAVNTTTNLIASQWLQFDLGQAYTLNDMIVWNCNFGTTRGIKECKVLYKVNSGDAWTQLGGASNIITLKQATGGGLKLPTNKADGIPVMFDGANARYVRIEVVTNYGDTGYVGLSEVRFYKTTGVVPVELSTFSVD